MLFSVLGFGLDSISDLGWLLLMHGEGDGDELPRLATAGLKASRTPGSAMAVGRE